MEDDKLLNIAAIAFIYGVAMTLIFGLLYVSSGSFQSYHETFMGINVADVSEFNANLMALISIFIRIIGFSFLALATILLYLILGPIRKGEKVAWIVMLIVVLLVPLPITILTGVIGGTPYIVSITVLIGDFVGLALSAKPCLTE